MTLNTHEARVLLREHLNGIAGLPTAYGENRQHDRPARTEGAVYLEEELVLLSERHRAMGFVESQGVYRIVVFVPQHHGTSGAENWTFELARRFKATQTLCAADDSFGLVLYRTERARQYTIDGWTGFPVHVRWRSTTPT